MFKRLMVLGAAAGAYVLVNKRKKTAAAEARLWDEATGRTGTAPTTSGKASTTGAPAAGSNGVVGQ